MNKSASQCLIAFALTLTGALSGCATNRDCDRALCMSDAQINAKIEAQLAQDPEIVPNSITVQTRDRRVYLYGEVYSSLEIDKAKLLAKNVPGVTEVVSSLVVSK